jgi:tetratricopeptide (TPR) repeat protein
VSTDGVGVSSDSSDTSGAPELVAEPTRLDRYVLLERIGRGSSASVWAAYDPQLDRRVAIKLLYQRGDELVASTHLDEAQALARLSHPHVVAIHDVQSFAIPEVGRGMFIVMEFLAGASLSEWMNQAPDWELVVAVFRDAGRGLAAAHEHGLVHRDFKPSNVMFGADGRVRVLDFGLARSSKADKHVTQARRIAGTPAYMAPEQHLGDAVDARSDQFAFCATLYEALYRQRPFAGQDRVSLGMAKLRGEIIPPSRTARVPAWLHTVVLRGLAADPGARFPDMHELLDALARDPRRVRRRWMGAAAIMVVLAGSGYAVAQVAADEPTPYVCESPERELVGVWDDEVRATLEDSFRATQLPFADNAYRRIEQGLDGQTQEWVQLHHEVCEATMIRREQSLELMAEQTLCLQRHLRKIGGFVSALEQADAASIARAGDALLALESPTVCRQRVGVQPHSQADGVQRSALLDLEGEIARAGVLTQLGRYEEAVVVAQGAIDQSLELPDADGAGRAWLAQTRALWYLGRYDEAIHASEQAIRWAAKAGDQETHAMAQIRLIRTYTQMGKYDVAEAVARIAAGLVEGGRLGRELEAWYDLYVAILYTRQLRWNEAMARLDHGLALREQLYGPEHPELAAFHNTYGNALLKQGDLDRALPHYHEALRLWEGNFGPEYPDVASVNNNIGAIYFGRAQYDEARQYFERALTSYELSLGHDNPQIISTLTNLAFVADGQGRRHDALELLERARAIASTSLGDDSLGAAQLDFESAKILYMLGHIEDAEPLVTRALDVRRRDESDNLPEIVETAELLADCQLERGDIAAWQATLARLLEQLDGVELGGGETAITVYFEALLARQRGAHEQALALSEQHIAALTAAAVVADSDISRRFALVIELLLDDRQFEAAAERAREQLASPSLVPADRDRWQFEYLLGRAEAGRGEQDAAIAAFERALEFCSGPDGNPRWAKLVREQLDKLRDGD